MSASEYLKAAAFEAGAEPALIIGADGGLSAANEAAETLFAQGLGQLQRSRLRDAIGHGDELLRLMARATETGAPARERDLEIVVLGQPVFHADATASPLTDGAAVASA